MDQGSRKLPFTRSHIVVHLKRGLERDSFPRLQMGLIVFLTGAAGLFCSYLLLHAGVASMTLRYPIALLLAYLVFLCLLWVWLRATIEDYFDALGSIDPGSASGASENGSSGQGGDFASGGGGDFAGGGATGSYDQPLSNSATESGVNHGIAIT
jgi:uncharacterized membrane protein YgcG